MVGLRIAELGIRKYFLQLQCLAHATSTTMADIESLDLTGSTASQGMGKTAHPAILGLRCSTPRGWGGFTKPKYPQIENNTRKLQEPRSPRLRLIHSIEVLHEQIHATDQVLSASSGLNDSVFL